MRSISREDVLSAQLIKAGRASVTLMLESGTEVHCTSRVFNKLVSEDLPVFIVERQSTLKHNCEEKLAWIAVPSIFA